jgi:phage shock protein PspC (stress-responsive transcriptional regulator)
MNCPYCRTENAPGATRCAACTSWLVEPRPVREWTRARSDRMIAGVARGLATRFGLPIAAVRLVFLLSVLLGGWGILVYVALWIAMPLDPAIPPGTFPVAAQPQARGAA